MPQLTRQYCSRCKVSIFNCMVDGVRVPIVFYFVVAQPDDTGEFDFNGPGVKLPSFVREIVQPHVPTARVELCMNCVKAVFGVELVTAEEDSMYSGEQTDLSARKVRPVLLDPNVPAIDKAAIALERVLTAIQVGRGAKEPPPLPPAKPSPLPASPPAPKPRGAKR